MSAPLLRVSDLVKTFGGDRAVDGVTFELAAGETLAMIGPNGAGKSTCFNLIGGQLIPDGGRVALQGQDVTGWPPRRMWRTNVGRTFQVAAGFGSMTAGENVRLALASHAGQAFSPLPGWRSRFEGRAQALLHEVGLEERGDDAAATLAYGDRKRLELAMALAAEPVLLLMDEPTAGMDPAGRGALMELASRVAKERGAGVLFTEHDVDVVFGHADRVLVLEAGRLIADGLPEEVRVDPAVRRAYLGEEEYA